MSHWDAIFAALETHDPYRHLKSIHNGDPAMAYNHRKPWVDHVCLQNWDVKLTTQWRADWGKPILNDEPEYEGNIPRPWGNISGQELVHRFWLTVMRGGYAGHGETFMHPTDEIWWSKGGVLRGESWKRIGFLRDLIEADVTHGPTPFTYPEHSWEWTRVSGGYDGDVLHLFRRAPAPGMGHRPADGRRRLRDRPHRHLEHDHRAAGESAAAKAPAFPQGAGTIWAANPKRPSACGFPPGPGRPSASGRGGGLSDAMPSRCACSSSGSATWAARMPRPMRASTDSRSWASVRAASMGAPTSPPGSPARLCSPISPKRWRRCGLTWSRSTPIPRRTPPSPSRRWRRARMCSSKSPSPARSRRPTPWSRRRGGRGDTCSSATSCASIPPGAFIDTPRTLGKPLVMRMNLNQQGDGAAWAGMRTLMQSLPPLLDCGVHYVDMMCLATGARPTRVQAIGARLSDDAAPGVYNYGQLQITFDDGSVGWYEAGWGPMISTAAYAVKDIAGPRGSVSMVGNEAADPADVEEHTRVRGLRSPCRARRHGASRVATNMSPPEGPDHDALCELSSGRCSPRSAAKRPERPSRRRLRKPAHRPRRRVHPHRRPSNCRCRHDHPLGSTVVCDSHPLSRRWRCSPKWACGRSSRPYRGYVDFDETSFPRRRPPGCAAMPSAWASAFPRSPLIAISAAPTHRRCWSAASPSPPPSAPAC